MSSEATTAHPDLLEGIRCRIESRVRTHGAVRHGFLDALATADVGAFRAFVFEQYRLSTTLPQALAALYASAPDVPHPSGIVPAWEVGYPLLDFLRVEHWGGEHDAEAHSRLFIELATSLGITQTALRLHRPLEATVAFCNRRIALCQGEHFLAGLGAIAFANEFSNTLIFPRYLAAVRDINRRATARLATGYFEAHVRDETADYARLVGIMQPFAETLSPDEFEQTLAQGAQALLDARIEWYDALERRVMTQTMTQT